jgi:hypothetical protein
MAFGEHSMSRSQVFEMFHRFKEGGGGAEEMYRSVNVILVQFKYCHLELILQLS